MWATCALLMALSQVPAQAGSLQIANVRSTYGILGATRSDNKLLPGDNYFVTFDIDNLTVTSEGEVRYSMGMELINSKGVKVYQQEPRDLNATNSLGGSRLPAFAIAQVGNDTPAGPYTLKLTVTDLAAKKSVTLEQKFDVVAPDFGLVRLGLSYLQAPAVPAPPVGVAGQTLLINCDVIGFLRTKDTKQPSVAVQVRVLDDTGKPTLAKPFSDEVAKDVPETSTFLPLQLPLELNRLGKFTVELQATDRVSKKTAKLSFPLTVLEMK